MAIKKETRPVRGRKVKKIADDFDIDEISIKNEIAESDEEFEEKPQSKKRVRQTRKAPSPVKKQKIANTLKTEEDFISEKEHLCGEPVWVVLKTASELLITQRKVKSISKDEAKLQNYQTIPPKEIKLEGKLQFNFQEDDKSVTLVSEDTGEEIAKFSNPKRCIKLMGYLFLKEISKSLPKIEKKQLIKYEILPLDNLKIGEDGYITTYGYYEVIKPEKRISVNLKIYLNTERLKFLINNGFSIPFREELVQNSFGNIKVSGQEIEDFLSTQIEKLNKESNIPVHIDNPLKQPDQLKLQLYRYQLNALTWMKRIEEKNVSMTLPQYISFTCNGQTFYRSSESSLRIELNQKFLTYTCPGGIFADEMGLGKTLVLIALTLSHPKEFEELGFKDKKKIESKATLVISPNHLTKQWELEIEKSTVGLKVILITTKLQWKKVRYTDLMHADFVIVSFQFLVNVCYKKAITITQSHNRDYVISDLLRREFPFEALAPFLHHFNWHRLILDEGHEIFTKVSKDYHDLKNYLCKFEAEFKWYVSGTPFPEKNSLFNILTFFDVTPTIYPPSNQLMEEYHKKIIQSIYWRNTKESVGDEYEVPQIVEEIIYFELSEVERGMYLAANSNKQKRQICCHPQISSEDRNILGEKPKKLEEIREEMINHKVSERGRLNKQLRVQTEMLEELLESGEKRYMIDSKKSEISKIRLLIQELSNSISYFESIAQQITQSTTDPCSICLDQFNEITITSCGHLFCYSCIKSSLGMRSNCPLCRTSLSVDKITRILDEQKLEKINLSHDLISLISKYGSKMAKLITMIKELFVQSKDNRIIIFSQWDQMLHRIGDTLSENNISHVYCQGSVFRRWKAIQSFKGIDPKGKKSPKRKSPSRKTITNNANNNNNGDNKDGNNNIIEDNNYVEDDEVRVIMLSLENAASGTNLTEATHIFLMDPVAKGKLEAKNIEAQAIGRALRQGQKKQITVVRLLAKNTIEEEIYTNNYMNEVEGAEIIDNEK